MFRALRSRLRDRSVAEVARLAAMTLRHAIARHSPDARARRTADGAFDARWGTDTQTGISVHDLGFDAADLAHARRYDPSDEAMLREPVAMLALDPARYAFVDYGAGKGRMLMLAMEMGFAAVTGVELSSRLCAIARANIARFIAQHDDMPPALVAKIDAGGFAPIGTHILAYLYNPFDAVVMTAVRVQLEQAHAERVVVIYANPEHDDVFADASGWLRFPAPRGISVFLR